MSYNEGNVKQMIDALPSHFSLARYVLVVVEAMRGRNVATAFDKSKLWDFVEYCAAAWNQTRAIKNHINPHELWEMIADLEQYEQRQRDRIRTAPP